MRRAILAAVAVAATAGAASAQGLEFKPIDTNALVVQPSDAATNIFSRTARFVSRAVAGTIEENGFVKTLNNLIGIKPQPKQTSQPGLSPLPLPGLYPSTGYKNTFMPAMPTYHTFGKTPGSK
jgi:hypothetical protein